MHHQFDPYETYKRTRDLVRKGVGRGVRYCQRKFEERRAERKNEKSQDKAARRTATATWWIAGFTIVTAVVGVKTYLAIDGQLVVMRGQLAEMKSSGDQTNTLIATNQKLAEAAIKQSQIAADQLALARNSLAATQRPWVSADMNVGSDLKFSKEGASFTVSFKMKNHGNIPAFGVWVDAEIHLARGDTTPILERDRICRKIKSQPPADAPVGFVAFPQGEIIFSYGLPIAQAEIDSTLAQFKSPEGTFRFLSPYVAGCVNYRSAQDKSIHQTGFVANILRVKPEHPEFQFVFDLNDGDVQQSLIRIQPYFYGGYAD